MVHHASGAFWQNYQKLAPDISAFQEGWIRKGQELWSARATLQYRAVAVRFPDAYVWTWIGRHGVYDLLVE